MAAAAAVTAAPPAPAAKADAPAMGPAAAALAAIEAAAAVEAAAAKKAAAEAKEGKEDSDETSMSDADVLPEAALASIGEAGAAAAGQPALPCGVLPAVDAPVAVTPVEVPVGDAGFGFSPALLGLLGLGALGLGFLLLRKDDDDDGDDADDNEAPVAVDDTAAVNENATVTGSVATNDTDADDAAADLDYALTAAVPGLTLEADGDFSFDAGNAAYADLAAGATEVVTATYTVTDPDGASDTGTLTITITGVNDAPVATDDTAAAAEDATITGSVATNDSDVDDAEVDLDYALTAAVAGLTLEADGDFTFDASNAAYADLAPGVTQTVTATYTVTDPDGASDTGTLTITITGANDPPVLTAPAVAVVAENQVAGTVVLDASAVDTAGDDTVFSLTGADAALFAIDATTGVVTTVGPFNFEADSEFNITVVATDEGGLTDNQAVVVTITDVNEVPAFTSGLTASVDENVAIGTEVYDANAVDPDGDALTFTLSGDDAAGFTIDADTGEVFLAEIPDFEANAEYDITVTVSDGTASTTQDVVITVNDLDDLPTPLSLDVDPDSNPLTANTIDAGADAYIFSDDDDTASNVILVNFGADDEINFEAAVVAYAAEDTGDGDGLDDLLISVNNGGIVSSIRIEDVADDSVFVLDEATAEAAVAGTDTFHAGVVLAAAPIDTFA